MLKRRRTMADSLSLLREQKQPESRARPRDRSADSNESDELKDESGFVLAAEERDSQKSARPDMWRRSLQQLDVDSCGARGGAFMNSERQKMLATAESPATTFADNDEATSPGHSNSSHRDHSSRRHSSRHSRRSRSRSRSRRPSTGQDHHRMNDRRSRSPSIEKPKLTGSNADPVPFSVPRHCRRSLKGGRDSSLPYTPPALPDEMKVIVGDTPSKAMPDKTPASDGRVKKAPATSWLELSPTRPARSHANARSGYNNWDASGSSREVPRYNYRGWSD
ncbi:hypothetical protein GGI21_006532, partial [Coemansia aciculifera]